MLRSRLAGTGMVAALLVPLAGCLPKSEAAPPPAPELSALPIAPEDTGAHYDRADWPHWSTVAGTCDTRETILRDQGRNVTTGPHCKITAGQWISPYDGVTVTDPRKLDIDHVVPLAEVQRSGRIVDGRRVGPREWSRDQREQYANDPAVLLAVTAATNRAKGDQDPARWLPDRDRCSYVARWIEIKQRYDLSVDQAEHDALVSLLSGPCTTTGGCSPANGSYVLGTSQPPHTLAAAQIDGLPFDEPIADSEADR